LLLIKMIYFSDLILKHLLGRVQRLFLVIKKNVFLVIKKNVFLVIKKNVFLVIK